MPWSYNPGDLSTSIKDQIRMEIQDTDVDNQLLQDEEIVYMATQERNFWAASARCCEVISRHFMAQIDIRLGRTMMLTYSKMAVQYQQMASKLRAKAMGTTVPWVGGMSVTDKITIAGNTDIVAPQFTKTMMENPWVGGYTTDSNEPVGGGNQIPNVEGD